MSLPHCVSSAALDIEHGREGGHFALQKRPHNLVAPNAVAHIATSQKGLACTPRDPKCGRFFFVFLDFGQISPPAIFGQPWPATGGEGGRGGGGRGGPTPPAAASRGLEHPRSARHGRTGRGGGGTFQVRVGPVLTQHMRGWGGTFHRLCWGRVNTSNRYVVRVVCCVVLFSFCVTLCCVVLCHSLFCFGFFSCVILCSVLVFYFVVLCCVVLCCVVLCCVVLCCVVLLTQHNITQHNTTQHNTTQHNTTQHNTTQHNTTQNNTTQHNTKQHNTTQHNTTQHNKKSAGSCVAIGGTEGGGGTFQVRVGPVLTQHRRGWGGTFYLCVGRPC